MVGPLGLLLGVMVTAADVGDRAAAHILLEQVAAAHHRLARDFERRIASAEETIYWSMAALMTRRLVRPHRGRG
ncbi:hypothetical protein ACWGK1_06950 [Streptomyces wedmorensis]